MLRCLKKVPAALWPQQQGLSAGLSRTPCMTPSLWPQQQGLSAGLSRTPCMTPLLRCGTCAAELYYLRHTRRVAMNACVTGLEEGLTFSEAKIRWEKCAVADNEKALDPSWVEEKLAALRDGRKRSRQQYG